LLTLHRDEMAPPLARFAELAGALDHETRLIGTLIAALRDQRAAVAADDAIAVEASVRAVSRALLTLSEARRNRLDLSAEVTGAADDSLDAPRRRLRAAAAEAAREVAINQAVLGRALAAGEAFLQQLLSGAADPTPAYEPMTRRGDPAHAAVLFDGTA
jgi:hypothetical protein